MAMRKRRLHLIDDDEDEAPSKLKQPQKKQKEAEEGVKPIGKVIQVSQKEGKPRKHFASFEVDGIMYELWDSVMCNPSEGEKPYTAVIKDITLSAEGIVNFTGQWFYHPEEAEKIGGGYFYAQDTRELFYSFHTDEVPAGSVMHKCVTHFVPLHKQLPLHPQCPGFIVQKVYDHIGKKLWKLKDKDYEDDKQHEIDLLVEKTRERLGKIPDILTEGSSSKKNVDLKRKKDIRRKSGCPIDISKVEETTSFDKLAKAYASSRGDVSKYHAILSKFKVLTGDAHRDKWLEKLLQGFQVVCNSKDAMSMDDKHKSNPGSSNLRISGESSAVTGGIFFWPHAIIPIITILERVTYEALGVDFQKYNQKMRQLDFNIKVHKNNALLARRLLNKELEPIALLTMTPEELKEGLTADERITFEPETKRQIQMTDARCSRCMEKQVGVSDIIKGGRNGDRYQLECAVCGHVWFASRDIISL